MNSAVNPRKVELPKAAETVMKASIISAKYSAGAERKGEFDDRRRNQRQRHGCDQPGNEGTDRGSRKGGTTSPGTRHLVALERSDDRCAFTWRIQKNRRGRAAIHAAIIDTGKHDQRSSRIELIGNRQQQGDRKGWSDAGQNADGRAQCYADQCIKQIERLRLRRQNHVPVG